MREATVPKQPTALVETIDIGLVQELIAMWQRDLGELSPVTRASYRRGAANIQSLRGLFVAVTKNPSLTVDIRHQ